MNKILLVVVGAAGIAIGAAGGVLWGMQRSTPGSEMIMRCRDAIARADALDGVAKAQFCELRETCQEFETQWRVITAIASVEPAR